jgi:hypothetical protein
MIFRPGQSGFRRLVSSRLRHSQSFRCHYIESFVNRVLGVITFLVICFLIYAFYISQFQFQLFNTKNQRSHFFYDYKLSQNIHTHLSLGSGTTASIVSEAKHTHQDFLLFTDVLSDAYAEEDRYLNQIGLLFGNKKIAPTFREITYKLKKTDLSTKADLMIESPSLSTGFDLKHLESSVADGIEVFNLKVLSQKSWEKSKISTLWSILLYPFNPRLSLMRLFIEPLEELRIFDQISQKKPFSMFLGAEVSARAIPITNLIMKLPSYERVLGVGSQHLLLPSEMTGNIELDKATVIAALKSGKFYISFDELGDPSGFEAFVVNSKNKKFAFLGDEIKYDNDKEIYFKLPAQPNIFFEVVLFKNGVRIDHLNTFEGSFKVKSPGIYRIQVRLSPRLPLPDAVKWLTWIYTNNFYFR